MQSVTQQAVDQPPSIQTGQLASPAVDPQRRRHSPHRSPQRPPQQSSQVSPFRRGRRGQEQPAPRPPQEARHTRAAANGPTAQTGSSGSAPPVAPLSATATATMQESLRALQHQRRQDGIVFIMPYLASKDQYRRNIVGRAVTCFFTFISLTLSFVAMFVPIAEVNAGPAGIIHLPMWKNINKLVPMHVSNSTLSLARATAIIEIVLLLASMALASTYVYLRIAHENERRSDMEESTRAECQYGPGYYTKRERKRRILEKRIGMSLFILLLVALLALVVCLMSMSMYFTKLTKSYISLDRHTYVYLIVKRRESFSLLLASTVFLVLALFPLPLASISGLYLCYPPKQHPVEVRRSHSLSARSGGSRGAAHGAAAHSVSWTRLEGIILQQDGPSTQPGSPYSSSYYTKRDSTMEDLDDYGEYVVWEVPDDEERSCKNSRRGFVSIDDYDNAESAFREEDCEEDKVVRGMPDRDTYDAATPTFDEGLKNPLCFSQQNARPPTPESEQYGMETLTSLEVTDMYSPNSMNTRFTHSKMSPRKLGQRCSGHRGGASHTRSPRQQRQRRRDQSTVDIIDHNFEDSGIMWQVLGTAEPPPTGATSSPRIRRIHSFSSVESRPSTTKVAFPSLDSARSGGRPPTSPQATARPRRASYATSGTATAVSTPAHHRNESSEREQEMDMEAAHGRRSDGRQRSRGRKKGKKKPRKGGSNSDGSGGS